MMKKRKLGIGLLLMLAVVVTTGTFAYWASGLNGATTDYAATVTIGEGAAASSTITLGAKTTTGDALIPSGRGSDGTDDTATWTIPVEWDTTAAEFAGDAGTLAVTVEYSMSGNTYTSAELDNMFSFSVTGDGAITEGEAAQDVVVTVVFDQEPSSEAIYDDVINETLTVTITFTVTVD